METARKSSSYWDATGGRMYANEYKGVWFVEGDVDSAHLIEPIKVTINGLLVQNQLKTLDDVKDKMVARVRAKNGNAVVAFKYGQRSTFWRSIVGMDDVHWFATGVIAIIPDPKTK